MVSAVFCVENRIRKTEYNCPVDSCPMRARPHRLPDLFPAGTNVTNPSSPTTKNPTPSGVGFFVIRRRIRTNKCNSPVDCCLPPVPTAATPLLAPLWEPMKRIRPPPPQKIQHLPVLDFLLYADGFEQINAAVQRTVACRRSRRRQHLYLCSPPYFVDVITRRAYLFAKQRTDGWNGTEPVKPEWCRLHCATPLKT